MQTRTLIPVALFLIVAAFVMGKLSSKPITEPMNTTDETLVGYIGENSTTTAFFSGFYSEKNYGASGESKCPALLVSKNNDPLFLYFSKLVQDGNTVNSIDQNGNLLLNINLGEVASESEKKILTSTKENPVNVEVQKLKFESKGADPCTSFVRILSVE